MSNPSHISQPLTEPGIATAEEGLVVLDGPDGVAVTMTREAAVRTGKSLIAAAERPGGRKQGPSPAATLEIGVPSSPARPLQANAAPIQGWSAKSRQLSRGDELTSNRTTYRLSLHTRP